MPRVTSQQTNFTAGELSPRLYGRTDIDRYGNAAKELTNAKPVIHGGAKRRGGFRFVNKTLNPNDAASNNTRLIKFIVDRDNAYQLEFGEAYLRIHKAGGTYTGVQFTTSYGATELADIDFTQSADAMFLMHPSHPTFRLRRFSDTVYDLSVAPFNPGPFAEQGQEFATSATLSAATVGVGRTITAASSVFLPTDVGRTFSSGGGLATITGYTSGTVLTATISIPFASTVLAANTWRLDLSPNALLKSVQSTPVGATTVVFGESTRAAQINLSALSGAITINATAAVFVPGDTGKDLGAGLGGVTLTYVNATQCTGTTYAAFQEASYPTGAWGIEDATFRSTDVGSYLRVNGGLLKITSFTSSSRVNALILAQLDNSTLAPPLAWSLETSVWSPSNGYPRSGTINEQRLVLAGSTKYPQTIWGSETGDYYNFQGGTLDTDGYSFTIANDEVNPISYVASLRNLVAHTYGGEFSLLGGIEKPITPTNVRIRPETQYGSKEVRPVQVGKGSVFVQRAGRKIRSMGYTDTQDGYDAPDLALLAEHITTSGILSMDFQQEPDFVLWCVRADGAMVSCTVDTNPGVGVTGWARHITQGAFESVSVIPNGDQDEVWVIVKRPLPGGGTVRTIEIMDETFEPLYPRSPSEPALGLRPPRAVYGYTVDSGLAFDNATGQQTFSVPHLALMTVDIVADGAVQPQQVVGADGLVTIPRESIRTLIGLPFQTRIGLLSPEIGTGTGSAQGNSMRISEISVRFLDTLGAKVLDGDGQEIGELSFRQFGSEVLDQPPELYSGLKRTETLGWERGRAEFTIVQDQPLPMHVLSVIRKLQVND